MFLCKHVPPLRTRTSSAEGQNLLNEAKKKSIVSRGTKVREHSDRGILSSGNIKSIRLKEFHGN